MYLHLFCGTLICPLSIWQLVLTLEWICWTGKIVTNAFPMSTDVIQVFKPLPTDRRRIKVLQEWYAIHTSTTRTNRFLKSVCSATRPWCSPFNSHISHVLVTESETSRIKMIFLVYVEKHKMSKRLLIKRYRLTIALKFFVLVAKTQLRSMVIFLQVIFSLFCIKYKFFCLYVSLKHI